MQITTGSVVDRYIVEGILGEGGMATVYRVQHNQLGTYHALKVLTVASVQIAKRLVQEGRVQATLRHPNIVAVTDIVDLSGSPGLIMELINGPSLDEFLVQEQLSIDQVDALASGILAGVAAAHGRDLIHRDLKPANIMLAITPGGLVPKVTDFGLAKILGGGEGFSNTRTGSTMGTPHYMSPEQIRDSKNVGPRADVFSLGAILYEMLAGRRAFEGDDLLAIFNAVASGERVPIRDLCPEIPERMERAIDGAMEVDLGARIASVTELLAVWSGDTAPKLAVATGPWDAAVLAKASSMSVGGSTSSLTTPLPDLPTGAQRQPPSRPTRPSDSQAPPTSAELDVSLVSPPSNSDSIVNARSLMIGVGGTAAIFGLGTVVTVGLALGAWFFLSGQGDTPRDVPQGPGIEATAPVSTAPVGDGQAAPVGEEPSAPGAEEAPVARPTSLDSEAPAPGVAERVPVEEDPVPEDSDPEGVADPTEDTDAVVDVDVDDPDLDEEPEAADIVEEVDPGDPRAKLPADLRSQSTSVRSDGLSMRESQEDVTWLYAIVVRHDPHSELRKKAWKIVQNRWRKGIGPRLEHEEIALWVLDNGTADQRVEAIDSVSRNGSDVMMLKSSLADTRTTVRRAAVDSMVLMARRTGQADPARIMLNELKNTETDSKTLKKIADALESI